MVFVLLCELVNIILLLILLILILLSGNSEYMLNLIMAYINIIQ